MAIPRNFRDGSIVIEDGTGTPLSVTVAMDLGTFSGSGFSAETTEVSAYQARGVLVGLRKTNKAFPTFSISAIMSEFSIAAGGNVVDMILGTGTTYAARISTTEALGDVITFDVVLTVVDPAGGGSATLTMQDCHIMFDVAEGDPNQFTFSGTCYGVYTFA